MAIERTLSLIFFGFCFSSVLAATTPSPRCSYLSLEDGLAQCSRNDTTHTVACTGVCNAGLIFATGEKEVTFICDDLTGIWNQIEEFPKCVPNTCMNKLVAMVDDSSITASSYWSALRSYKFGPERGRLNSQVTVVNNLVYSGGWKAGTNTLDQYIQVELANVSRITGVVTQGRSVLAGDTANEYVSQYRVLYSIDGKTWRPYSSIKANDQFLSGNVDRDTPKANVLSCTFDAKYVRINPLAWHENIALRFELLGCAPDNTQPSCRVPGTQTGSMTTNPPITITSEPTTAEIIIPTTPPKLCSAIPPPANGMVNCETQSNSLVCVSNCADGFIFETHDHLVKRVCNQDTGVWAQGSILPKCIENLHATPLPPAHNFPNGCVTLKKDCKGAGNGDFQACGGCHFFATCSEGYLYIRACPEALLFDAVSGLCDYHSRSCPT